MGVVSIEDITVYYGSNSTAMSAARISTTILASMWACTRTSACCIASLRTVSVVVRACGFRATTADEPVVSIRVIDFDTAHLKECGAFMPMVLDGFRVCFPFKHHDRRFANVLSAATDEKHDIKAFGNKALIDEAFTQMLGVAVGRRNKVSCLGLEVRS